MRQFPNLLKLCLRKVQIKVRTIIHTVTAFSRGVPGSIPVWYLSYTQR
jgi:hypothetical protein